MSERVVDFPHPVGPTTAQNSPAATVRSISRIAAIVAPVGVMKLRLARRSSMLGGPAIVSVADVPRGAIGPAVGNAVDVADALGVIASIATSPP